jgi:hypothetical protein
VVVHLAAEPKHLLRLVPVELSLSLGHPSLLLTLQLLAKGHAEGRRTAQERVTGGPEGDGAGLCSAPLSAEDASPLELLDR